MYVIVTAALLTSCAPAPAPVQHTTTDPTGEAWYHKTVAQLEAMNREAENLLRAGKRNEAAGLITKGQPLSIRLLAVPRPTLEAMEAASDLDQLYGRMLFASRNYGWARLLFQKNLSRWRTWKPQTAETARRLKLAEDSIEECDKRIAE